MTVREYYRYFGEKIPSALSCEWDNDGLLCCPDQDREVRRVLVSLDVTEKVVEVATAGGYDLILAHHPMIFHGMKELTEGDGTGRKLLSLVKSGISVMAFHTRLDAVDGGVNDVLASLLDIEDAVPFGIDGIGRIGSLCEPIDAEAFARSVKDALKAPVVKLSCGSKTVSRVAVLGGSGKDDVLAAIRAGADTYVTGELAYHQLVDAPEMGVNLVEAGHFYTEYPVCERLKALLLEADPTVDVTVYFSDRIRVL